MTSIPGRRSPKILWTRMGVVPGKAAGGAGTKRETTTHLGDRYTFYIYTHQAIFDWYREFGITVEPFHLFSGGQRFGFGSILFLLWTMWHTLFVRVHERMDIVAARNHDLFDLFPALIFKFRTKGQLVVYIQSRLLPVWGGRPFIGWLIVFVERAIGLLITRLFADAVVLNNYADQPTLRKLGIPQHKIFVVYPGVFAKKIARIKSHVPVKYDAMFFGRVTRSKGIFDLINAWRQVLNQRPDARLAVVGDMDDHEEKLLRARILKLNLSDRIDLLGGVVGDERYRLLKQARLFVQPSYVEQWSIALGEAIACSLPAVVYDIPTTHSIWGETIYYCKLRDVKQLSQRILEVLENEDVSRIKVQQAYDLVQNFTWERFKENESKAMESIIGFVSPEPLPNKNEKV